MVRHNFNFVDAVTSIARDRMIQMHIYIDTAAQTKIILMTITMIIKMVKMVYFP